MIDQNSMVGRFIQAAADVSCAVIVTGTTTLMAMGSLQSLPRTFQGLFPMMNAGAALLLGYRMGEWETERRLRRRGSHDRRPQP